MERGKTVYLLYSPTGQLLYVGITASWSARIAHHAEIKEWFPEIASAGFEHFSSPEEAQARERDLIIAHAPRYNIAWNPAVRPVDSTPVPPRPVRESGVRAGRSRANAAKTHCKRGHSFTVDNTYISPTGGRICKTCVNDRQRIRNQRIRESRTFAQ